MRNWLFIFLTSASVGCAQNSNEKTKEEMKDNTEYNQLNDDEKYVIVNKGTERPYSGKFYDHDDVGTYTCKQCNQKLFESTTKFEAGCGWPSFDEAIPGAVRETTDADGRRTEITCANCGGHLGHVFKGEGFTDKNTRHCVNSISLNFVQEKSPKLNTENMDSAIFASGCFWGTEYFFERAEGVLKTEVGYIGGKVKNPTYKEVCTGKTGHAEATKVYFDPSKTDYKTMCKLFFETHDPSQIDRQGPDIGTQYRTEVFYLNEEQRKVAEELKDILEAKGIKVATNITEASEFYVAEKYHQQYYTGNGSTPYCHGYTKRFDD